LESFAQLPYLQHLIRGYNDFQVCTRRIHLVWQLDSLGKPPGPLFDLPLTQTEDGALAQDLLNQALKKDILDNGYVSRSCPSSMMITDSFPDPLDLRLPYLWKS
jgi:hypothetical protein